MLPTMFSVNDNYRWNIYYDDVNHGFFIGVSGSEHAFALVNQFDWTLIEPHKCKWHRSISRNALMKINYDNIVIWMQKALRKKTPDEIKKSLKIGDENKP